jgi:hypothetical protein
MSLKILFVGDIHLRATRPISRMDEDYAGTIINKIGPSASSGSSSARSTQS